jgi:hypothetical protein
MSAESAWLNRVHVKQTRGVCVRVCFSLRVEALRPPHNGVALGAGYRG